MRILAHPNPALKAGSDDVDPKTDRDLPALVERMAATMYEAPGVGLAAPQIGVQKRVIVFDADGEPRALCNPVLSEVSEDKLTDEEGCLSVPGITVPVERHSRVVCEALTLEGENVRVEAEEFLARVLQHEIDHLNGVLIIDRATPEDRKAAVRRYMSQAG